MNGTNGVANGHSKPAATGLNGAIKSSLKGQTVGVGTRTMRASSGPGMIARIFNLVARLLTWYLIVAILFQCPATLDACDESSPRICKPYFQVKQAVTPHIEPYYNFYAAPYVDVVKPYYNAVDQKVFSPGWEYAKKYGAPQVQQVQAFGRTQWEKTVQPQLTKYQHLSKAKYEEKLAPHVDRFATAVGPYYDIARTNALQTYHELLLPSYQYIQPYAQQAYHATSTFTTETAAPTVLWVCNKTYVFLDGTVWPHLRVIYIKNVEPQLVKIGERLGRHSNGKKTVPKPLEDASTSLSSKTSSSFVKPAVSSPSTAAIPSASASASTTTTTTGSSAATKVTESSSEPVRARSSVEPVAPPPTDSGADGASDTIREARKEVAEDLRKWQERYTKAADEAEAEIKERVQEISKKMITGNARVTGKSRLEALKSAVVSELVTLRADILQAVGAVAKEESTAEKGQQDVIAAVRRAGVAIKEKAQEVRAWREDYEAEMQNSITTVAQTHFTILDEIRDLALQKIGMKWAWMDGVTYKDWAKYHELKNRLEEWKGDLERLIVAHPGIEAAQSEAADIEDEAMSTAATAAKELARLKQVANWKLIATDETPEFDSTLMQQAAETASAAKEAAASLAAKAQEAAQGVKDTVVEKVEEALGDATSLVKPDGDVQSVTSALHETASIAVEKASESISTVSEELSSVVEPVSDATSVEDTPDLASAVILEETPVFAGNTTELEEDGPAPVELPAEDLASQDVIVSPEAAAPSVTNVKPALFGAAAQSVPSRQPVLDDDEDDTPSPLDAIRDDLKSAYSAAFSQANNQYSQALSAVSVQIHGTPKPTHEQLLASVTSAYSNAMESASSRLDEALKAASSHLGVGSAATPTKNILPTSLPLPSVPSVEWAQIESIAAQRLQEGRAWAEEQYQSAKIAIGLATPTPSTPSEHVNKLLENARHNYYAGLGVAHDRYSEFMAAASSAVSSMTATPTPTDLAGTVSSLASVASESASSAASVVADNASSAAAAGYGNAASAASVVADNASSAAAAGYDNAASAASAVVDNASSVAAAGYENVASAAAAGYGSAASAAGQVAESWEVIVNRISVQVYGAPTPTPWYASAYGAAGDYAASAASAVTDSASSATAGAAEQYSAVSSILSELIVGKEPTFSESVFSRLKAAYETGASSASSLASAAQATAASAVGDVGDTAKSVGNKIVSAASEATEVVKEKAEHIKDEL
ncbi:hypothetical protein QBC37DRAFT_284164 [Rhypophila decipiens]|uniref:Transcription factor hoxa13 n=1 Tax=Rhypophila decipiens TaxID=261697 RepID=A0AAN7B822_9PEZI|nr:hypothetical protein QBC37DRAFT_284164 [Rhypophila decipiens]